MDEREPVTETLTVAEVRDRLDVLVNRVRRDEVRVVIEADGRPVAAIVPAEDFRELRWLDRERAERWRILEAMRAPFRDVPPEEIERETERIVAEVRAEMRAERLAKVNP